MARSKTAWQHYVAVAYVVYAHWRVASLCCGHIWRMAEKVHLYNENSYGVLTILPVLVDLFCLWLFFSVLTIKRYIHAQMPSHAPTYLPTYCTSSVLPTTLFILVTGRQTGRRGRAGQDGEGEGWVSMPLCGISFYIGEAGKEGGTRKKHGKHTLYMGEERTKALHGKKKEKEGKKAAFLLCCRLIHMVCHPHIACTSARAHTHSHTACLPTTHTWLPYPVCLISAQRVPLMEKHNSSDSDRRKGRHGRFGTGQHATWLSPSIICSSMTLYHPCFYMATRQTMAACLSFMCVVLFSQTHLLSTILTPSYLSVLIYIPHLDSKHLSLFSLPLLLSFPHNFSSASLSAFYIVWHASGRRRKEGGGGW